MRIEVSLPHLLIFDMNKILCSMDCVLFLLDAALLFFYRSQLNLQYLLLGMMSGFLFGIFLRTRYVSHEASTPVLNILLYPYDGWVLRCRVCPLVTGKNGSSSGQAIA